jgi:hypothetical protein
LLSAEIPAKNMAQISIVPNPATNEINVTIHGDFADKEIQIESADGSLIMKKIVHGSTTLFDISMLPSGLYIISYRNQNSASRSKLIVQH